MYSYEEAFEASLKYFNGDELAAKVFLDKYSLRDSESNLLEDSPEKMHWRLANEFARIEKNKFKNPYSAQDFFNFFDKFQKIVPQGSPMFGIGNNYQTISISNCFVLETPEDSYSSILQVDEQLVNISKRRGGVGIDLDKLRPAGTPTKNAARSSTGIVSWMERYSNSIREVGQHGRRGALMLTLSVHHPDILDFCTIKNDHTKVTGANISVKLTTQFLEAVKNDETYIQQWPLESFTPSIIKEVKARDIWKVIINSAWQRAEPGLLMWDNILNEGPADCYKNYRSVSTNPCLPKDCNVLTKNGLRQLKDISIGDFIWSKEGWTKIINKWSTGIKDVYEYKTTFGSLKCTENHFVVSDGIKIEVQNAESIDLLRGINNKRLNLNTQDIIDGLVFGDGSVHKASGNLVTLMIGQDDQDYFDSEVKDFIREYRPGISPYAYEVLTTITAEELPYTFYRKVPDRFKYGGAEKVCAFLRGLYTANGSICGDRITLKSASFNLIQDVQLLLNSVGIASYYTINKPSKVKFSNGEYLCKESYDLNITRDKESFFEKIGFIQKYKQEKVITLLSKAKSSKSEKLNKSIISREYYSTEEVFDITVDNLSHTFYANGWDISNCSEITLCALDSCRLLTVNLFSFVQNPFTINAYFDYNLFSDYVKIAQRAMDDIVDLESEKIDKILEKIYSDPESNEIKDKEIKLWEKIKQHNDEVRRTGLGITALGDTLASLNIKYGSEESIVETDKIYKTLKHASYESSIDMAEELGAFKEFDWNKEKNCPFFVRFLKERPDLIERMKKVGRRNIAITTTAPTGTVSIMTQTTSGIEPLFMMGYKRRKKVNPADTHARVDFVDQNGDKWQEFMVYHPTINKWMEITGETDINKSPWFGCCANDINWVNRVKLQAVAQKHVCHSISSTINLPKDVSEEKVAEIYEMAFASGCKGITIYREGCRTGVMVAQETKTNKIQHTEAPKRPDSLPCNVHHMTIKGHRYYVVVGKMDEDPYEIFIGSNHDHEGDIVISKNITNGEVKKKKRSHYVLISGEKEYKLTNGMSDHNADALTRLLSTGLRHGAAIQFLVDQLEKTEGDLFTFAKVLARTLKKYIKDGTDAGECECGGQIVRENGCKICKSCGQSACS